MQGEGERNRLGAIECGGSLVGWKLATSWEKRRMTLNQSLVQQGTACGGSCAIADSRGVSEASIPYHADDIV